jgi:hypothetical protein
LGDVVVVVVRGKQKAAAAENLIKEKFTFKTPPSNQLIVLHEARPAHIA